MYELLKTLGPGWIRTRDLLFCMRTRWPLCHAARASLLLCKSELIKSVELLTKKKKLSLPCHLEFRLINLQEKSLDGSTPQAVPIHPNLGSWFISVGKLFCFCLRFFSLMPRGYVGTVSWHSDTAKYFWNVCQRLKRSLWLCSTDLLPHWYCTETLLLVAETAQVHIYDATFICG
jgi:hypothetical protein